MQVDTVKIDYGLPVESLNEVAAWIKGQIGTAPKILYCTGYVSICLCDGQPLCAFKRRYKLKHILAIVADSAGQIQPLKAIFKQRY